MAKIDTGSKFNMAVAAILKTHINRHNSAKFARQNANCDFAQYHSGYPTLYDNFKDVGLHL